MKFRLLTAAFLTLASPALAAERPSLVAMVENDSFLNGIDRHYTSGLYFSWTGTPETRDDGTVRTLSAVMLPGGSDAKWREGYFFGQSMFTPEYMNLKVPLLNDRPYAGWLYGGARLYRAGGNDFRQMDTTRRIWCGITIRLFRFAWHPITDRRCRISGAILADGSLCRDHHRASRIYRAGITTESSWSAVCERVTEQDRHLIGIDHAGTQYQNR